MRKILYMAIMSCVALPALSQETYDNAIISTHELNGTARYVGMGGAMEALGADISTIATNPAGLGLFRHSTVGLSVGMVSQQDADNFGGAHKNNLSFDQVGFVWANQISETDYVNFGFNYHKSRNFNYILSAAGSLGGNASQNKWSGIKGYNDYLYETKANGTPDFDKPYVQCTQLDMLYTPLTYQNGWGCYDGTAYLMNRAERGHISEFNFSLSGNVNNNFYWGFSIGAYDVDYHRYSEYTEDLIGDDKVVPLNYAVGVDDERRITGSGIDLKLGVIFRPIDESPLRFGISVATPTWYKLRTWNDTSISDWNGKFSDGTPYSGGTDYSGKGFDYDFKLYTPWRFGLSAGHTIGNQLALGVSYEFTDYSSLDSRYDYSTDYREDSKSDDVMNRHTADVLRGVSTLKLGAEYKPAPELAVRLGYNYVSPMYHSDGMQNGTLDSDAVSISSNTDYTNWDATHRITCGLGWQFDKWNVSAAYQYSTTKGKFSPFRPYYDENNAANDNVVEPLSVNNKRHQLLCTVSYTF